MADGHSALGLEGGRVVLASEHKAWSEEFVRERQRILDVLAPEIVAVEHVGSTALPGVPAKPILDILLTVVSFEKARVCVAPMQGLGYEYRGEYGIQRRHYFVKGKPRTHHVHMHEVGSPAGVSLVTFRDALLARPELAQEYREAKLKLAAQYANDRDAYQQAKDGVIARLIPKEF